MNCYKCIFYLINSIQINILNKSFSQQILFKAFFWLTAFLLCLSLISLVSQQTATFLDRLDLFLSIFSLLALFGCAYEKQILTVIFWRYFFYFGVFETIIYSMILPLISYERYRKPFVFNGLYVFEIVYAVILLYVLYFVCVSKALYMEGKARLNSSNNIAAPCKGYN